MSLIESDSKSIDETPPKAKSSGRKARSSGLNRFKGLNRFSNLTDKHRKKQQKEATAQAQEAKANPTTHGERISQPARDPELNVDLSKPIPEPKNIKVETDTDKKPTKKLSKETSKLASLGSEENKSNYDEITNKLQNDLIEKTIELQSDDIETTIELQKDYKEPTQLTTQKTTNKPHDSNKDLDLALVSGQQRKCLNYLYTVSKATGSRIIGPINMNSLSEALNLHHRAIRTHLERLSNKGYLIHHVGKVGRGGFKKYEIPESVYKQLSMEESIQNEFKNSNKLTTIQTTQLTTNPTSSSSYNLNYKKTTPTIELTDEWKEIITPDNLKEIGFGEIQIKQLFRLGNITPEKVQESLDAFSYDLEYGEIKSRGPKLNFLMGILRTSGAYISDAYLREIKSAIEENQKRQKAMEELRLSQAEEALAKKAIEHASEMSDEEKLRILPENSVMKFGSETYIRVLVEKIKENIS